MRTLSDNDKRFFELAIWRSKDAPIEPPAREDQNRIIEMSDTPMVGL